MRQIKGFLSPIIWMQYHNRTMSLIVKSILRHVIEAQRFDLSCKSEENLDKKQDCDYEISILIFYISVFCRKLFHLKSKKSQVNRSISVSKMFDGKIFDINTPLYEICSEIIHAKNIFCFWSSSLLNLYIKEIGYKICFSGRERFVIVEAEQGHVVVFGLNEYLSGVQFAAEHFDRIYRADEVKA